MYIYMCVCVCKYIYRVSCFLSINKPKKEFQGAMRSHVFITIFHFDTEGNIEQVF